jgi:general secretion pathway protein A
MYAEFYRFAALPFQLTPDARFFFESAVHRQAMAYLVYGLHHAEGFIVVTGEVGAGKTILVENLLSTIDESRFVTAKIVTSQLGGEDLLRLVVAGFGIADGEMTKGLLLQRLTEFLLAQYRDGKRALLIVDEAQNLSVPALEELRMLSNIVVDATMALQSFLLAQPQFRDVLGSPELEQLRQRIIAAYHLGPLSETDTRAYVEHRLRRAGWEGDPHFEEAAFPLIYRHTEGVPRRINALCSRLLLYGFLEQLHSLPESAVEKVAEDQRTELAAVAVPPVAMAPGAAAGGRSAADPGIADSGINGRIRALEDKVGEHEGLIRRALEIAPRYLRAQLSFLQMVKASSRTAKPRGDA